jgi:hypothetical protein
LKRRDWFIVLEENAVYGHVPDCGKIESAERGASREASRVVAKEWNPILMIPTAAKQEQQVAEK